MSSSSSSNKQDPWSTPTPTQQHHNWSIPTPTPTPTPTLPQPQISIIDDELPYETHNTYTINFFSTQIHTTLTHDSTTVTTWLSSLPSNPKPLTIGLDIEWRPSFSKHIQNPAATLQLCVGNNCLVFQLIHAPFIPPALVAFLANVDNCFVGIGIRADLEKLEEDWEFGFRTNFKDLRTVAAERLGDGKLRNAGLKELARVVLGRDVPKPKRVTMSRWDYQWLSNDQVLYASVDAFVCYEIARVLNEGNGSSNAA